MPRWSGIFLVEDIECRQADVRDFLLAERDFVTYYCLVRQRIRNLRTACGRSAPNDNDAIRMRQRDLDPISHSPGSPDVASNVVHHPNNCGIRHRTGMERHALAWVL